MSELKDYDIMDIEAMDDERFKKETAPGKWVMESRVYLKVEADKVFAELEQKLEDNVDFWKKKLDDEMASRRDEYEEAEKEIRHHKYKRCLGLKEICLMELDNAFRDPCIERSAVKCVLWRKWANRWHYLAQFFKEEIKKNA